MKGDDPEYCQVGYGVQDDGTAFVCNTTYMPGVTSEMLDWWFPWHSVGSDLRYKIWDRKTITLQGRKMQLMSVMNQYDE